MAATTFTLASCILSGVHKDIFSYSSSVLSSYLNHSPWVFGTSLPLSSLWLLALFATYVIYYSVSFVYKRYILCSQLQKLRHENAKILGYPHLRNFIRENPEWDYNREIYILRKFVWVLHFGDSCNQVCAL